MVVVVGLARVVVGLERTVVVDVRLTTATFGVAYSNVGAFGTLVPHNASDHTATIAIRAKNSSTYATA